MSDYPRRRSRSRSPSRKAPKGSGGFRWKDRRQDDSRDQRDSRDRGRHESNRPREYRDRSPQRDRGGYSRDADRQSGDSRKPDLDRKGDERGHDSKKEKKEKKPKKAAPVGPGQEMIIVHINDRLGTKSAVPCLPSDTVGQLKMMIAARIGRKANQIMLRRQGERPFKDQLTLDDYGISNGVQLDLEIDTGD
ncbi:Putative Ubiquitin-like modifier hub1 [[Torrubiella] hemipterigena]|uniref:Ubiquitin-like modifier HUB1 n=1 Tax=[Torrubiella] hemipterigena TaxID=1531966 RepID=A0A0A1TIE9_9HYPO|nr:Putative Ubiquitin-like modifier hub1 [[Torrubiella] hemipterigena]